MTREEKFARMAELRATVEAKVKEYNEAKIDKKFEEVAAIDEVIEKAVNEYSGIARGICFEDCAATENPMMEAIKRLSYETIGIKDTPETNDKAAAREVVTKERQIDLLKLHKYVNGGIGSNKEWNYYVEKFNYLLTAKKAIDLGIKVKEINDSYAMSDISKQIDMGGTPTSNTNILKTLTTVVQAMIGEEYKPSSHDVSFLLSVYSKKSRKALTVSCANHKYMRGYLMEICNRIVTGKTYGIEYKAVKPR